jgi:hypothetical protein
VIRVAIFEARIPEGHPVLQGPRPRFAPFIWRILVGNSDEGFTAWRWLCAGFLGAFLSRPGALVTGMVMIDDVGLVANAGRRRAFVAKPCKWLLVGACCVSQGGTGSSSLAAIA